MCSDKSIEYILYVSQNESIFRFLRQVEHSSFKIYLCTKSDICNLAINENFRDFVGVCCNNFIFCKGYYTIYNILTLTITVFYLNLEMYF